MSIERVVVILTPIFGAAAAWLTGLIGAHFPGVSIDPTQVIALEVAGFTGATAAALKWLHGRQKFVAFTDEAKRTLETELAKLRAQIASNPAAGVAISDIETLLASHESQIEQAIDSHVPKAVGQSLQALFSQLGASAPSPAAESSVAPVSAPANTTTA